MLLRAGVKQEKICFIFDESNVLDSAFLERMNALLASGEVPGLFEDADHKQLMAECKEVFRRDGSVESTFLRTGKKKELEREVKRERLMCVFYFGSIGR